MGRHHDLRAELRGAGLRATPARVAVLGMLRDGGAPMTHGEVADRLDGRGWDRATIFRNLVALVDAGFVRRTDVGDHVWRFEPLADGGHERHEHAHFLCTGCGEVTCMPELELKLPRGGGRVPQSVRSRSVEVQLRGLCDECG
jgi:Fur family ferric uptake transcriptional regulator